MTPQQCHLSFQKVKFLTRHESNIIIIIIIIIIIVIIPIVYPQSCTHKKSEYIVQDLFPGYSLCLLLFVKPIDIIIC